MNGYPEHISPVESDPGGREWMVREALQSQDYQVQAAEDANAAIMYTQSVLSIEWRPYAR